MAATSAAMTMLKDILRISLTVMAGLVPAIHVLPSGSPVGACHRAALSLDLDDDFAFCASFFDVSQSLVGRFEWKDPIHNRANDSGIDERRDFAQLIAVRSHEQK